MQRDNQRKRIALIVGAIGLGAVGSKSLAQSRDPGSRGAPTLVPITPIAPVVAAHTAEAEEQRRAFESLPFVVEWGLP